MKQIVCDICGEVIRGKYSKLNLPTMYGGLVLQTRDIDSASDVCETCAIELYNMIDKFKFQKGCVSNENN